MKKLLLLTNLGCVCFLFASCQNSKISKTENAHEIKPVIKKNAIAIDTTRVSEQTPVSGTIGVVSGTQKDSIIKTNKTNKITPSPDHNAPEQEKIDSIKKSKLKVSQKNLTK